MRISDWSSDVCSSDLQRQAQRTIAPVLAVSFEMERAVMPTIALGQERQQRRLEAEVSEPKLAVRPKGQAAAQYRQAAAQRTQEAIVQPPHPRHRIAAQGEGAPRGHRSEEHTSELQSLMRISYAV